MGFLKWIIAHYIHLCFNNAFLKTNTWLYLKATQTILDSCEMSYGMLKAY